MFGAALLSLVILATLGGFFFGWPLAIAYRFASGEPTPLEPREGEPWSAADVMREGWHRFWTGRLMPRTPRRHVPWEMLDLLLIVLAFIGLLLVPALMVQQVPKPANPPPMKLEHFQLAVLIDGGMSVWQQPDLPSRYRSADSGQ